MAPNSLKNNSARAKAKITIFDYASGDMLNILKSDGSAGGSFKKSKFSSGTLSLTISGDGQFLFDNVTTVTDFNINGTSYKISGSDTIFDCQSGDMLKILKSGGSTSGK